MHYFHALVGYQPVNETKAQELGLALIYESGFVIVPLIEENVNHYEIENGLNYEDYGEEIGWDNSTILTIAKLLGLEKFVIMLAETPDFIGTYYSDGKKVLHEVEINVALRALGVPIKSDTEFDYLNLDSYRNSEFFYMDEIVGRKDTSNIVKGTILYPDWNKDR